VQAIGLGLEDGRYPGEERPRGTPTEDDRYQMGEGARLPIQMDEEAPLVQKDGRDARARGAGGTGSLFLLSSGEAKRPLA
jgi:hypothetical protein